MICYEDKLDAAINGSCPTVFGMERTGYLCLRSEIAPKTETDYVVDFVPRLMIPVYQPAENAYKPKSDGERNTYGLTKFNKSIELFLVENTALTQEQIKRLENDDWVSVLNQRDGQIQVWGFERGLTLKTSSQDLNSTETHGGIVLTMVENYVNTPMLFGNANLNGWLEFDTIYGGTIATGGAVKLTIDSDKTGYIKLPNGNILTTVAGVINTTYTGVGGAITYYIPKTTGINSLNASSLAGNIFTNIDGEISIAACTEILGFNCDKSIGITATNCTLLSNLIGSELHYALCSGCALTAKSIGEILYAAYTANRENVNFDFRFGTNALDTEIDSYLRATYNNLSFSTVVDYLDLTGTLLFNNFS